MVRVLFGVVGSFVKVGDDNVEIKQQRNLLSGVGGHKLLKISASLICNGIYRLVCNSKSQEGGETFKSARFSLEGLCRMRYNNTKYIL